MLRGGTEYAKTPTKTNKGGGNAHENVRPNKKIIKKHFYPLRKSCVGDHKSVNWIKIMDSAKLAAATFLIYLFVKGMFTFASML